MDPELKKLIDEMQKTHVEFKAANEKRELEIKAAGTASADTVEKLEKMNTRFDEIEVKMKKMSQAPTHTAAAGDVDPESKEGKAIEVKAAYMNYLRTGDGSPLLQKATGPDGQKALSMGTNTLGSYLASPEFTKDLIKDIVEFSPVREKANVRSTSNYAIMIRKRTGVFAAQWTGEKETRTETEGLGYGREELPTHELYAMVDISNQDLEDPDFNLEQEINSEASEQFGVAEGTSFISGNSVKRPEGLLTNGDVGSINSGDANLITADSVISLWLEPKGFYAKNGTWLLRRSSLKAIRLLKDDNKQYLWTPGFGVALPATILASPYLECPDMPAIAANAYPIIFGDIRRAYTIADRVVMTTIRDPFTQAASGDVRFWFRKRVGAQVVQAEAIKKLKISA